MFSDERERVVVVVSGFDDDSDSVARRGEETVREPRAKSSANGTSVVYFFFLLVVFDRREGVVWENCLTQHENSSSYLNQKTGGTAVTSVSIGNFRTAETRENAV
tara:strand:- start:340 stop:654 length:315 start_codon:yes stop_codon:yes gene_type:complete